MLESFLLIVGFWLLFLRFAYWIGLSFESQHINRKVLLSEGIEGIALFWIFVELFGKHVILSFTINTWSSLAGFLCICVGVGGSILAKRSLGSAWVHAVNAQIKPRQSLITTGLYTYVRHPIYSSIILSYIGSQLLAGSWLWVSCLFLFIPAYFQAKKEEKLLEKHFGKRYKKYMGKSAMLIPWVF